jgi:predicted nucleic acid-binding protein
VGQAAAELGPNGPTLARVALTLVLDANVVLSECSVEDGFADYRDENLVAPAIMWSEARSTLHEAAWRRELALDEVRIVDERLERAPVRPRTHPRLGYEAWRVADELGWAKTYDAEYVALARLLGCRFVTPDARLRRGDDRLGFIVSPLEL